MRCIAIALSKLREGNGYGQAKNGFGLRPNKALSDCKMVIIKLLIMIRRVIFPKIKLRTINNPARGIQSRLPESPIVLTG